MHAESANAEPPGRPAAANFPGLPADLLRQARGIRLAARRAVAALAGGDYHSAFHGIGLRFEDVREYQPGDDVRSIDWNVTARTGRPHVKRFVEDRELTVLLLVDCSASMAFGSTGVSKSRIAAELAAVLAMAAIQNGDRVGLIAFTDQIESYVPPRRGTRQTARLLRRILAPSPDGRGTRMLPVVRCLMRMHKRRAIVVCISDFQADDGGMALGRAVSRHEVIAIRVSDPREVSWNHAGRFRLRDQESGRTVVADAATVDTWLKHDERRRRDEFKSRIEAGGAELLDVDTAGGHVPAIVHFLHRRARRRR